MAQRIGMVLALQMTMPHSSSLSSSASQAPVLVGTTRDWACPFCPLLCDDIAASVYGDHSLSAHAISCPRLTAALSLYGGADAGRKPTLDGVATELESVLDIAANILAQARRPLFGGLATDVAGARSVYELAAHCGAIVDHLHGDALAASTLAMQDRGAFFTTLSEVRSRADLIIVFACQPSMRYPRFYERTADAAKAPKTLTFLACPPDPAAPAIGQPGGTSILPNADPYDVLAVWSALAEGRSADALRAGHGDAEFIATLHERIVQAKYTAIVFEPAALPAPHAALLIEALNRIVKSINKSSRAGCLALAGDDGASSVNQAMTWLSGLPLRTRVSKPAAAAQPGALDHDPWRYQTTRLLAAREVDALLWIASFVPQSPPDALADDVPAIVLGHPALADRMGTRQAPTLFVPVATPGIDSDGHLFRVDGSVVVPLRAMRDVPLPTVASVVEQLSTRVRNARSRP
jgi:formylmethanofuran dehydrogenase subunit B